MSISQPGTRTLTELVEIRRSTLKPEQIPDDARYVGLEHIESGTGTLTSELASAANLRSAKNRFETGDVLFGKLRPNLRKAAVAPFGGVCSTDILVLRPLIPGLAHLIALQLRSAAMLPTYERLVAGANLPRLSARDLSSMEVWVPDPLATERLEARAQTVSALRSAVRQLSRDVDDLEAALAVGLSQEMSLRLS